MGSGVGFRGRGYGYGVTVGVVVGLLTAGVAVPFIFGEQLPSRVGSVSGVDTASGALAAGAEGDAASPASDGGLGTTEGTSGIPGTLGAAAGSSGAGGASGAAGTSGGGDGPTGSGSTGSGPTGASLGATASDVGVTADRIKLGLLYIEASAYGRGAQEFLGDSRGQFKVFVDEVNDRGGIHGRKIEPVYVPFDALDAASRRRACLTLTEDHKVFAAMTQTNFIDPAIMCLTKEHRTPFIAYHTGGPDEYYRQSEGRYFSATQSWTRHYRYWIAEMDRMGLLRGKKIGLLDADYPPVKLVADTVPGLLAARGHRVTKRFTFTGDISASFSQIPVAVQEMKSAGVDTILVSLNFLTMSQFVNQADAQLYKPQYLTNEQAGVDANAAQFMPAGYDGAIGITSSRAGEVNAGLPEPAADAECRQRYEQVSGTSSPRTGSPYQQVLAACWLIRNFARVAESVGPNLTRDVFVNAMQQYGGGPLPFFGGGGFARGKFDAADLVRTVRFQASCRCFMPQDSFRRIE